MKRLIRECHEPLDPTNALLTYGEVTADCRQTARSLVGRIMLTLPGISLSVSYDTHRQVFVIINSPADNAMVLDTINGRIPAV